MADIKQQVVLITGAKGGLGSVITRACLEAGATVAGSSRSIVDADFPNPHFAAVPADLSDPAAATHLAGTVIESLGRIDSLIHVAGGFAGGKPLHETDEATWDGMMNLNARAAFHVLRAVIPHMRKAGTGRIVAIGSRAGVQPAANISAYSASKAALVSLVQTVALENKDAGITANVILPGTIDTEANRRFDSTAGGGTWIAPERLAALALFLISDAAAQITGAGIPMYGRENPSA
ncbi:Short-chain dehydrogenase/reductase SDR [Candidatus Sulfopaludibacter sp. SbA3]|nr:Short-chain dehydrogenase/reductase SDR [Candidatus Sulfopaludibacter sp. SbA3]